MLKHTKPTKSDFKPLFNHAPEAILQGLCRDFADGFSFAIEADELHVDTLRLAHPDSEVITSLMRATKNRFAIVCQYTSLTSGTTTRQIVPHAIINNGHRWHTRAYDRQSGQFKDFVCSRFSNIEVLIEPAKPNERREQDSEWNRIVTVELIPHPKLKVPQAVAMDYRMVNGSLKMELRAALVGYLMQRWQVDCSIDHSLNFTQYQLALANSSQLYDVSSFSLSPGFIDKG